MIVIIPALIKTAECENALRATIRGIPNDLVRKIVVVSQGRQPRLEHVSTPQIDIVHVPTAIGKWPAIQLGCRKLPEQSMVLLLDADDAFDHSSLADFLKRARSSNYESVAGKRDEILLHSENSGVPTSRPFLEIFSNTLAMQSIGYVSSYLWDMPPDIQVGLRLIRSNHLLESKVERSQFYGGELLLFEYLTRAHVYQKSFLVKAKPQKRSSLNFSDIIAGLKKLDLFSRTTDRALECAGVSAPLIYSDYLDREQLIQYRSELPLLIKYWRSAQ